MIKNKPKAPVMIPAEKIHPFEGNPFKVTDNDEMNELIKSITENGILEPLTVRPIENTDGEYEIIAGHRRYRAAQKAGLTEVPAFIRAVSRDEAAVMLVDSNLHRERILPSEKAFAYKLKMEALSHQGKRTDLTSSPVATKSDTAESIGIKENISRDQVYRFIRLTFLIPELLQFVDEGKIKMRPAVEMSYLGEETQRDIVDCIDENCGEVFPSHAQTRRIREQAENGGISYEEVAAVMNEEKPNQVEKIKIPTEELRKRIGKNLTDEALIKYLYDAVDYYKKHLQRQREQAR